MMNFIGEKLARKTLFNRINFTRNQEVEPVLTVLLTFCGSEGFLRASYKFLRSSC